MQIPDYTRLQKLGFVLQFRLAKTDEGANLYTDWERNFIQSVSDQEQRKGFLSDKQWVIISKLFDKLAKEIPEAFEDPPEDENPAPLPAQLQRNPHRTYSQEAPFGDYDDDTPF